MPTNRPNLSGYPIDTHLRDHRPVAAPVRTAVRRWFQRPGRAA